MTLRIEPVDPTDADGLIAWNEIMRRAYVEDREAVWWRTPESTVTQFGNPRPGRTSIALLAVDDTDPVGGAEALAGPETSAEVEVGVLPSARRRGVGSALAAEVARRLGGVADVVETEVYGDAGVAFAEAHGLTVGNREVRQLLDLPVPAAEIDAQARPLPPGTEAPEIRSWVGATPQGLATAHASLRTQMSQDVPRGELTRHTADIDVTALRRREDRMAQLGYTLVVSLARVGGEPAGYTEIIVAGTSPLVERAFRGRGVGRALKLANLRLLATLPQAAGSRWLQTYTTVGNAAMLALNRSFGFREADIMTALEGPASLPRR